MHRIFLIFFCSLFLPETIAINITNSNPGEIQKQIENDKQIQSALAYDKTLKVSGLLAKEDIHYIAKFVRENNFENVDLSKSQFKEIGLGLFENCTALKVINLPNTVKTIAKHAFKNCIALNTFQCPKSLTSIGTEAFLGCTSLKCLNINKYLSWIGDRAFSDCNFDKIKGKNKTYIVKNNHIYTKNGINLY